MVCRLCKSNTRRGSRLCVKCQRLIARGPKFTDTQIRLALSAADKWLLRVKE